MKRFTIDRERWLRGDIMKEDSQLLSPMGRMCCLGFYLEACGAERVHLRHETLPSGMTWLPLRAAWLLDEIQDPRTPTKKRVEDFFTAVNDDENISEAEREKRIHTMFKKRGWLVRFVGRTRDTSGPPQEPEDFDFYEEDYE